MSTFDLTDLEIGMVLSASGLPVRVVHRVFYVEELLGMAFCLKGLAVDVVNNDFQSQ